MICPGKSILLFPLQQRLHGVTGNARSSKYEECYLKDYQSGEELYHSLEAYFDFYHRLRPHQGLNNQTPEEVYQAG